MTRSDLKEGGLVSQWQDSLEVEWANVFPVLPHLRQNAILPDDEYYREPGLPAHKCPGEVVAVDYHGIARSCCSLGEEESFLVVGDTNVKPLREIYDTFQTAAKQRILRETGPIAFARGAIKVGLAHRIKKAYAGPCDLCLHIRTDLQLRRIAEEMAAAIHEAPLPNQTSDRPHF